MNSVRDGELLPLPCRLGDLRYSWAAFLSSWQKPRPLTEQITQPSHVTRLRVSA